MITLIVFCSFLLTIDFHILSKKVHVTAYTIVKLQGVMSNILTIQVPKIQKAYAQTWNLRISSLDPVIASHLPIHYQRRTDLKLKFAQNCDLVV